MPSPVRKRPVGPQTPAERTLHAIVRVSGLLRRLGEERMGQFGISPAQWGILRTLHRRHAAGIEAPRMSELGSELLVRPPGLSGAIARMEHRGLVKRAADVEDHRSRRICLTEAGLKLVDDVLEEHREWQKAMMGGMSISQQKVLATHLEMLFDRLAHADEPHADVVRAAAQAGTGRRGRRHTRSRA